MPNLKVVINHTRAPISTTQLRQAKGIEHFYYALLFTSSPAYKNRAEVWRDWLRQGFHVAVKEAPPGVANADKFTVTVRSNGKTPEITGATTSKEALQRLESLLRGIDALRDSLKGKAEAAKVDALLSNPQVAQELVKPVLDSLNRSAFRPDEIESYTAMLRRGLLALTHDEVTSFQLSLN